MSHRLLSLCLATLLLISSPGRGESAANPMLHQEGTHIVNGADKPIKLRGVNLGGWLMWEGLILGETSVPEADLQKNLTSLTSFKSAHQFRTRFYDNFITEADIARISNLGFNCVRVPLDYRLLINRSRTSIDTPQGLTLIDHLLDWCESHQVYVILDLHAAPGGQSKLFVDDSDTTSLNLWQSDSKQKETVTLWKTLAARYKNRTIIAGYDILNEPSPPDGKILADFYGRIIRAIRSEDTRHLILVQGGKLGTDFSMFPFPPDANMAYSIHLYNWFGDNRKKRLDECQTLATNQSVPIWVGEFGENTYDMISSTITMMAAHDAVTGWAYWTWKKAPTRFPGINTIKIPAVWETLDKWLAQPDQPPLKPSFVNNAMDEFIDSIKLGNTSTDSKMVDLLQHSK